ncbi:MAG: STT3 domain-containing protein [Promethearchaeota archaeon]|jgi:dolichyl-diphosphooligosaccharide--protein glycosyltransferase
MVKITASLRNFRDRIRTSVSVKTRNILFFTAIFLVVLLAVLIRFSPAFRGPRLIKAFDPWIQWYNSEYLSKHTIYEYFSWHDFKSWYPEGFYRGSLRPGLTFTVVTVYNVSNFFGLQISLYDICYFFPAIMGGITVLVMYYLGKEIHDRGTGLIAAFFLAFNPGHMQRTMVGFFDNETIGVFATLLTFLFLLKGMRTGKVFFAILGGLSLGYLSLSWGGYQFVYLIIPILCVILILIDKYNQNILITYAVIEGVGLLIFSLYSRFNVNALFSDLETGGIFLFTIILVIFHIIQSKRKDHPNLYRKLISTIKWGLIPALVVLAIIIWVAPDIIPFGFGARFQTILNPLFRENISLVASVAEQMPSPWAVFYYNSLIPLILTPLGIYFAFKILNAPEIFLMAFVLLMFYFTGSMIRIILIFSPAIALMGAYGLASILNIFGSFLGERKGVSRKRTRQLKRRQELWQGNIVVFLVVGLLGVAQVVHATDVSVEQFSFTQINPAGVVHDWEESLMWMRSNLQGTDVVVSWWDYGYWLTPIGNVTTVNDNATMNHTRIGLTGMALMQTNEIYSARAFKRLGADYVLVHFGLMLTGLGGDEGKWPWMIRICNDNYAQYKKLGLEEDNWAENSVFIEDEYQSATTAQMGEKWLQSQLVRLMFYGIPTNPGDVDMSNDIRATYISKINNDRTQEGSLWKDNIPDNGLYDYAIFVPAYVSNLGLVKLFKIDYTVLESNFLIQDAEVFENGYAVFNLKNTGTRDLFIKEVKINGEDYNFAMGENTETNVLGDGNSDRVWVDIKSKGTNFQENDVVEIAVTAESQALGEKIYEFSNSTSNFFVKKAGQGEIKINKRNSRVIQNSPISADMFLEVENIGNTTEILDYIYINDVENVISQDKIEFLSGSVILDPGDISNIHVSDVLTSFYPIRTYNKVGVVTPNEARDEVLFTSTLENYGISVLSEDRILSPEVLAAIDSDYRKHIPVDLNKTHAYTHGNGSTLIKINVNNTGDVIFGVDSIYLTESLTEVAFEDFYTESGSLILDPGEEDVIIVDATDYVDFEVNNEILTCVTGSFGTTVTSDVFYIHTLKDESDIQIIESIEGNSTSFIYANETGKLLIKNTGDELITIDEISVNSTLVSNVSYLYGTPSLDLQECAIVSFDIPFLKINQSNDMIVNVNTTSTAQVNKTLEAYVDPIFYDLRIDEAGTSAFDIANMTLLFTNFGQQNVTLESVYVNNTYIPLPSLFVNFHSTWIPLTSNNLEAFEIGVGDSMELTIRIDDLESILGFAINVDDELLIIIRVEEGAEINHVEIVI